MARKLEEWEVCGRRVVFKIDVTYRKATFEASLPDDPGSVYKAESVAELFRLLEAAAMQADGVTFVPCLEVDVSGHRHNIETRPILVSEGHVMRPVPRHRRRDAVTELPYRLLVSAKLDEAGNVVPAGEGPAREVDASEGAVARANTILVPWDPALSDRVAELVATLDACLVEAAAINTRVTDAGAVLADLNRNPAQAFVTAAELTAALDKARGCVELR